ncbi:hypothetical protein [Nocardia sp. NPDC057668]|uniref:hypothetical protein n=1 Tax=Nocardia sp. NPDC057668 TaxID=3346202 RepID=UPI0036705BEC
MSRKSPQEKKALSYARDRRNTYGENDKSSRKNIPRNKRVPNRSDRHHATQQLSKAIGPPNSEIASGAELSLTTKKSMWFTKRWRKSPDTPLAEALTWRLQNRTRRGMNTPEATTSRINRIERHIG